MAKYRKKPVEIKAIDEVVAGNHGVISLYRSPTLTDAEREAIEMAAEDNRYHQDPGGRAAYIARTLRGLLERTANCR
jgi:hypothetical protein